jgi:hypothetical protein
VPKENTMKAFSIVIFVILTFLSVAAGATTQTTINLVKYFAVNDKFVDTKSVYSDGTKEYLVGATGKLTIFDKCHRLVQVIKHTAGLTGVRGNTTHLFVTTKDGFLLKFKKNPYKKVTFVSKTQMSMYDLRDPIVKGNTVYAVEEGALAVNAESVFLAPVNQQNYGMQIHPTDGLTQTYGRYFDDSGRNDQPGTVVVMDRYTGEQKWVISLPPDMLGGFTAVALYADNKNLYVTQLGPYGTGIYIYDLASYELVQHIPYAANSLTRKGNLLIAGAEDGTIAAFDLCKTGAPMVAYINLRAATGTYGPEDLEIRSVFTDPVSGLVYATSSGGNDWSPKGLPTFFVLKIAQK